ncbi:response regulator [Sphingorhabdus sp.]|uniref:hybrid sensor histidine kinase/response regulator n=1 Tax=Sphingorhabdus sp. TaxID=1902408 RepID=UPI0035AE4108
MAGGLSSSTVEIFSTEDGSVASQQRLAALGLGAALFVSLLLVWYVSGDWQIAGIAFATIIALAAALIFAQSRLRTDQQVAELLPPDWSVTYAAIDFDKAAVAVSDRAGRLLCANGRFDLWFEGLRAPPDLGLDSAGHELLLAAGRQAWRDGVATADLVRKRDVAYSVEVRRSGGGDEYLVWRLSPIEQVGIEGQAGQLVGGRIGRAFAQSGIMAVLVGPEGRIRACNPAFALRAAGSETANVVNRECAAFLTVDDKRGVYFNRDGKHGPQIILLHVPLSDDTTEGPSLLFALDDDRKAGSAASQVNVEHLLSNLPLGLALVDRDGRFLFANEAFARVAGFEPQSLPPYPGDLVVAEDKAAVSDTIRRYARGQSMSGDIAVRLKNDPDEAVALSIAGLRGMGEATVLLGLKDNSEEARLKRQVAQATKMQAIGQLAGGVAHDFNNILTAILGYCDLMLLRHPPGDSDYDDIQQIKNNSNRAASLTRQLLAFSRQQTLRPQILQLPDVVAEVSHLLNRLLGENVRLEVEHGRGIGAVRADPGQLEQVIINLGVNARDAMPTGGVLRIETRAITPADVRAMRSEILPIGDYAQLSVIDSGTGIPRENLAKIFEPFFTTKEIGKGTGLGLSTVYGIVKQSGGFIFAESTMGKGTRFDIYLPTYSGASVPQIAASPSRDAVRADDLWGSGNLLLVEDEDMVRAVAERALVRQGYSVETARDGEEALGFFAEGRRYDLVVSDVVMPNMDGPTMARQLRKDYGDLKILFMSGYAEEQLRQSINLDNVHFLPKPFSVQQIAEAVKNALK